MFSVKIVFGTHSGIYHPNQGLFTLNFFELILSGRSEFQSRHIYSIRKKELRKYYGFFSLPLVLWHPKGTIYVIWCRSDYAILLPFGCKSIKSEAFPLSLCLNYCHGLFWNLLQKLNLTLIMVTNSCSCKTS